MMHGNMHGWQGGHLCMELLPSQLTPAYAMLPTRSSTDQQSQGRLVAGCADQPTSRRGPRNASGTDIEAGSLRVKECDSRCGAHADVPFPSLSFTTRARKQDKGLECAYWHILMQPRPCKALGSPWHWD